MEVVFLFFVVIALVLVIVPLAISHSRKANEAWSRAARELGLRFAPPGFAKSRRMTGRYQGFGATVDTYTRGSGSNSTTYTRFRITYRPLGLGLKLSQEGFMSSVTKLFGAQDIEVGEAVFDADVLVKGTNPGRIREFLTPARRVRIRRLLTSFSGATIGDREILWQKVGVERDSKRIVATVRQLTRTAWHLTGDREEDRSIERAMEAQDRGQPERAFAILSETLRGRPGPSARDASRAAAASPPPLPDEAREEVPREPRNAPGEGAEVPVVETGYEESPDAEPLEERVLEGELLYLAGRRGEAKERFERALREAPEDPEIREWVHRAEGEPAMAAQAEEAAAQESPLDAGSVCRDLFDAKNTSLDASRIFEERYEGRTIAWTGVLRKAEVFSYDFVFGSQRGSKAVFEVHELETVLYGDAKVCAVVQLPEEAQDALAGGEGTSRSFEGRLLKVDGFMRNIYVADGRLRDG